MTSRIITGKRTAIDIIRAYHEKQARLGEQKDAPRDTNPLIQTSPNLTHPENYILLAGRTHGSYTYPNLLVATKRTHLSEDWNQATTALHQQREYMLTPRQFVDFLTLLKTGTACDGSNTPLERNKQESILDDITSQRAPWRAEWLDHAYVKNGSNFYVKYHVLQADGSITQIEAPLEDCLMKDKQIDFDDWLARANTQGLPPKNVRSGNLHYWYPRVGAVARFFASADWTYLDCDRNPQCSNATLGVRAAKLGR